MKKCLLFYAFFFISIVESSLNPFATRKKSVYAINSLAELRSAAAPLRDRQAQERKTIDPRAINPRVLAEHFADRSGHSSSNEVRKKAEAYLRSVREKEPANYAIMVMGVLSQYQKETDYTHILRSPMITEEALNRAAVMNHAAAPTPAPTPTSSVNMLADLEVGLQQGLSVSQAGRLDAQFLNNVSEGVIRKFNEQLTNRQRMLIVAVALNIVQLASFLPAVTTSR